MEKINLVKIWSESIDEYRISEMLLDARLHENKTWEKFVFLTSWAVKLWWNKNNSLSSQAKAWIWQVNLMGLYKKLEWNKTVAQILIEDYFDSKYLESIIWNWIDLNTIEILLEKIKKDKWFHFAQLIAEYAKNLVWTVINHNDTTSSHELKNLWAKTDNDRNAVIICEELNMYKELVNAEISRVIFLTNTDWLLDSNWKTVIWWKIEKEEDKNCFRQYCNKKTSKEWTWWMLSKVNCSFEILDNWVKETIIANSRLWLQCLYMWHDNFTTFTKK